MRKKLFRLAAALLALAALLPSTALAFNNYDIDVDALKALTKSDAFAVTVTKKTVTDGVVTDLNAGDMLTLTLENHSGGPVEQVVLLVVCYDDGGKAQPLAGGYELVMGTQKRELSVITVGDLSEPDGAEFQINIPCNHTNFTGAQALVAQYASGGQTADNPLCAQWQELALGSPTHILD